MSTRARIVLRWCTVAFVGLAAAIGAGSALGDVDPGALGPFAVDEVAEDVPRAGGGTVPARIFYPSGPAGEVDPAAVPCPLVVYQHGFARSPGRYTDIAEHLASRGYIVMLGDFPCGFLGCDHDRNADTVVTMISWMLEQDATPGSRFEGAIDEDAIGTSGHSAGGLWALVAAARDPRIGASAPMDPVDNDALGVGSMASIGAPVSITYSEPSSCNADGSAVDLYAAGVDQKRGMLLVGANHCDPERDGDFFGCELSCGRWNAERHALYVRTMTAWFEYYLRCDDAYYEDVFGTWIGARRAEGKLTYDAELRPEAPASLEASWSGRVDLERGPPTRCAGVTSWSVYRRELPGGSFAVVATGLPIDVLTWSDETTEPGRSYVYVARDVMTDLDRSYESGDSPEAQIDVPAGGTTPLEASGPEDAPLLVARGDGTALDLSYAPAGCASDHTAYWELRSAVGAGPMSWTDQACALGASGSATIDPGDVAPGRAVFLVVAGNDGEREGSYGRTSAGAERPAASNVAACTYTQDLSGACP